MIATDTTRRKALPQREDLSQADRSLLLDKSSSNPPRSYWDVYTHCEHLCRLIEIAGELMPADVADLLSRFRRITAPDDCLPKLSFLKSILAKVYTMPAALLDRVLSGWAPATEIESRDDLLEAIEHVYHPFPSLVMSGSKADRGQWVFAGIEDCLVSDADAVQLNITYGTSQAEAIAHLERMLAVVRKEWDCLMRGETVMQTKDPRRYPVKRECQRRLREAMAC